MLQVHLSAEIWTPTEQVLPGPSTAPCRAVPVSARFSLADNRARSLGLGGEGFIPEHKMVYRISPRAREPTMSPAQPGTSRNTQAHHRAVQAETLPALVNSNAGAWAELPTAATHHSPGLMPASQGHMGAPARWKSGSASAQLQGVGGPKSSSFWLPSPKRRTRRGEG